MARYREVEEINGKTFGFCTRRTLRLYFRFGQTEELQVPGRGVRPTWKGLVVPTSSIMFERNYKWFAFTLWVDVREVEEVIHG